MPEIDSAGDQQMIDAVFNRSEQGLNDMARTYGALLYTVSMNLLHDAADAEECVNDTWLKVWNTIPPYRPTYLRSFLCKITRQIALDRYRANHRQKRGGDDAGFLIEWDENAIAMQRFFKSSSVYVRILNRVYFFFVTVVGFQIFGAEDLFDLGVRLFRLVGAGTTGFSSPVTSYYLPLYRQYVRDRQGNGRKR